MLCFDKIVRVPSCGGFPVCKFHVPAESTVIFPSKPSLAIKSLMIASAIGERQIFPKHTNNIFFILNPPIISTPIIKVLFPSDNY